MELPKIRLPLNNAELKEWQAIAVYFTILSAVVCLAIDRGLDRIAGASQPAAVRDGRSP